MELRFPLILDGATGTELQKRGFTVRAGQDIVASCSTLSRPVAELEAAIAAARAGT